MNERCKKCGAKLEQCYLGGYACPFCDCPQCSLFDFCVQEAIYGDLAEYEEEEGQEGEEE